MEYIKHLEDLERRNNIVRDRVRGVVLRQYAGFYLWGRPGTSKTFTVRQVLSELKVDVQYHVGHLTPLGLYQLIAEHPGQILVLDDVGSIFDQPVAVQILLAALGNQANDPRIVSYKRLGGGGEVEFSGGIILISNRELMKAATIDAFRSRVQVCAYDPSDAEIAALMQSVTAVGWRRDESVLTAAECAEVAGFVIAEVQRLGRRLELRMLLDKALPDFAQWRSGLTQTHWKDLVSMSLEQRISAPTHTAVTPRAQQKLVEQELLERILAAHARRPQQIKDWIRSSGKSERAFWRRLKEIEGDGDPVTQ